MVQGMATDGGEVLGGDMAFQLLWVTGPRHEDTIRQALGAPLPQGLHIHGYLDDMPVALEAADLTVSRAGAMSTSEFLAWGLPAVLVPLPTAAADHQTSNALALESAGCAVHLPQSSLDGEALQETVTALLGDPERMASMRAAALERARPDAAREIARELLAFLPPAEVAA
jgi:UDP-N-acetylglucosamine--N-acetylmuramyl-(pentapeptide) pyrophosphoryl-undecaprenol N-acetylglucosamine transferase